MEEAIDSGNVEKEVAFVVSVECIDSGLRNRRCPLPGWQIHPRIPSSWICLGIGSGYLYWDHSRGGEQLHHASSRQDSDLGDTTEVCFHYIFQLDNELLDSRSHHHVP